MENSFEIKMEVEISKSEEESQENNNNDKNNSYSNLDNISNDSNDNDVEIDNEILNYDNNENDKETQLTQCEIEHMNKIREQAKLRMEKYSDLSSDSNLIIKNTNDNNNINTISNNNININIYINNNNEHNISNIDTNENINNLSHNFLNNDYEDNQTNEINPNIERVFNKIHPYLFINHEPMLLIGPNLLYFIIIFSASFFLSIIFYSLKNESYFIMKFLFLFGYLFYIITYSLLMVLNPGIPTNKNNIDLDELKKNYIQCSNCNCIFYKNNEHNTFHCKECNICVESFERHCSYSSKCIGKNNKKIYKLWRVSIYCYLIIIFLYLIL